MKAGGLRGMIWRLADGVRDDLAGQYQGDGRSSIQLVDDQVEDVLRHRREFGSSDGMAVDVRLVETSCAAADLVENMLGW